MKKVVIIQRSIKLYQLSFFEKLKDICNNNNIELILIYGNDDKIVFNDIEIEWGIKIKNYKLNFFGKALYYQPVLSYIKNSDLIIVEQANKHLINYILWALNLLKIKRIAFWGHGINFQNDKKLISTISEFLKKQFTKRVHWFFAYTELSQKIVVKNGFPPERVTVLNNTIAVEDLKCEIEKYDISRLQIIKNELGFKSNNIGIFVGGMYEEKRLDFLLKSLEKVKEEITDFEMIFIGDGPEKNKVTMFSKDKKWANYLGKKDEMEKVPYFLISKLFLMPGAVGLGIIDSFVFGIPLVTTDCQLHGPEITYLENNVNGIMTNDDVEEYANAIIALLQDDTQREKLREECKLSSNKFTLDKMVENFYEGINNATN